MGLVLNIHGSGNELRKNFIKKVSASFKEQMGEDL